MVTKPTKTLSPDKQDGRAARKSETTTPVLDVDSIPGPIRDQVSLLLQHIAEVVKQQGVVDSVKAEISAMRKAEAERLKQGGIFMDMTADLWLLPILEKELLKLEKLDNNQSFTLEKGRVPDPDTGQKGQGPMVGADGKTPPALDADFGSVARSMREAAGMTQEDLAEKMYGKRSHSSAIRRLEGPKSNPTEQTIQKLVNATGRPLTFTPQQ